MTSVSYTVQPFQTVQRVWSKRINRHRSTHTDGQNCNTLYFPALDRRHRTNRNKVYFFRTEIVSGIYFKRTRMVLWCTSDVQSGDPDVICGEANERAEIPTTGKTFFKINFVFVTGRFSSIAERFAEPNVSTKSTPTLRINAS